MPISFDAVSNRVDFTDFLYTDTLGISLWIKIPTLKNDNTIIVKRNSSGVTAGATNEWAIFCNLDGTIVFDIWDGGNALNWAGATEFISATTITTNTWHHLVLVAPGSGGTGRIYINGVEDANTKTQVAPIGNTTNIIQLGARTGNNDARYFNGIQTEVAIWNILLTIDDVKRLFSKVSGSPLQVYPNSLKAYWPLNDFPDNMAIAATSASIIDRSFNLQSGIAIGTPLALAEQVLSYQP